MRTQSGLASKVLRKGRNDERPRLWDRVELAYTGWTAQGELFGTTQDRYEPAEMTVSASIPAWREVLPQMRVGEKRRVWVPEALAAQGGAGMPPGALVFDLELLEVERQKQPARAPEPAANAPANATQTSSGLAFRVLRKGRGKAHPDPESRVRIHYEGFTADGAIYDSTRARGTPDLIAVKQAFPGLREALLAMTEGERRRVWVPASLGFGERGDGPAGSLLVDLELQRIEPAQEPPRSAGERPE